ncbi:4,5-DOPA dioxygenase extradiol [soil metagenome]
MDRRKFIQAITALPLAASAMNVNELKNITDNYGTTGRMPVFFVGHGSPMNAIEDNSYTRSWEAMGKSVLEKPNAILVVSAHWLTKGTFVSTNPAPETIYDFGGFPGELYKQSYPAPGSPGYAKEVMQLVPEAKEDSEWGLDHGAWSVLMHLFPGAKIPVFQLSIDYYQSMQYHFDLATRLKKLRDKGVLIIGSGNIVHNLQMFFARQNDMTPYDWTIEFDSWVKNKIVTKDFQSLVNYEKQGKAAAMSVPTVDHYVPMIYSLGLADKNENIQFTNEETLGSISMRAFRIG